MGFVVRQRFHFLLTGYREIQEFIFLPIDKLKIFVREM